jgi:hypothetical protein
MIAYTIAALILAITYQQAHSFNYVSSRAFANFRRQVMVDDYIVAEGSGSPCRIKVIGVGTAKRHETSYQPTAFSFRIFLIVHNRFYVSVGGGGGNAVNRMVETSTGVQGVELWAGE